MDAARLAARHSQDAPRWRAAGRQLNALIPRRERHAMTLIAITEAATLTLFISLIALTVAGLILDGVPALPVTLPSAVLLILLVSGLRALLLMTRQGLAENLSLNIIHQLRTNLVHKAMQPAWRETSQTGSGQLATRSGQQLDLLQPYYADYLPARNLAAAQPALILLVVFSQDWLAGGLLLLSAPLIPLFMMIIGLGVATLAEQQQQSLARLGDHFLDRLRALPLLRISLADEREAEAIEKAADGWRSAAMRVLRVAFLSSAVLEFFASVAIASVAIYVGMALLGYLTWGPATQLTLLSGLLVLMLAPEFFAPLRNLGQHYHDRAAALAAMADLMPVLDSSAPALLPATESRWDSAPRVTMAGIGIRHDSGPDGDGPWLLRDLSIDVAPGEWLAISGISGSGKTSLADCLAGFSSPAEGEIQINQQPLNELEPRALRANLAWLGQQPHLLQCSLASNILPGHQREPQRIAELIRAATLEDVIAALPAGLNTALGDDGAGLSGGEQQRLALARALAHRPKLLILDEPTASLDLHSERAILASLRQLTDTTIIMFSHSQNALDVADRCLMLEQQGVQA